MRSDAQRNNDLIIAAAIDVFSEEGTEAPLELVAKRAGVGTGTLYRHFPTREVLIDAVLQRWFTRILDAASDAAGSDESSQDRLIGWFEVIVSMVSRNSGAPARLLRALGDPTSPMAEKCEVLVAANAQVLDRVASDGDLRDELSSIDVCRLVVAVAMAADQGRLDGQIVHGLLQVVADGVHR